MHFCCHKNVHTKTWLIQFICTQQRTPICNCHSIIQTVSKVAQKVISMWKDGLLDANTAMQLLGNGTDLAGTHSGSNPKDSMTPPMAGSKETPEVDNESSKKRKHGDEVAPKETLEDVLDSVKKQKMETGIVSSFFEHILWFNMFHVRMFIHTWMLVSLVKHILSRTKYIVDDTYIKMFCEYIVNFVVNHLDI